MSNLKNKNTMDTTTKSEVTPEIKKEDSEIIFRLKVKKTPRFKAGSELSKTVNKSRTVEVELDEVKTETMDELIVNVHLKSSWEDLTPVAKA